MIIERSSLETMCAMQTYERSCGLYPGCLANGRTREAQAMNLLLAQYPACTR
jgi:hypothetical protein